MITKISLKRLNKMIFLKTIFQMLAGLLHIKTVITSSLLGIILLLFAYKNKNINKREHFGLQGTMIERWKE